MIAKIKRIEADFALEPTFGTIFAMNTDVKAAQRQEMRAKRSSIAIADRNAHEAALHDRLFDLPAFKHAECMAVYNPVESEARYVRNLNHLFQLGDSLPIGFPIVVSDTEMAFVSFNAADDRSILEDPTRIVEDIDPSRIIDPQEFDLILVPGIAFDRHGNRLGQGKGYYDRYLPKLRDDCLIVGIAFDEQVIDEVAHDEHDYQVDYVVTPTRVISAEK